MPRSVNSVASRARRKRMMKHAKGYFGRKVAIDASMSIYQFMVKALLTYQMEPFRILC